MEGLTLALLEEIRCESFADDIPIVESMRSWSESCGLFDARRAYAAQSSASRASICCASAPWVCS